MTPLSTTSAGVSYSNAVAIAPDGTVAGNSYRYDAGGRWLGQRAVRWAAGSTTPTELGTLGDDGTGFADATATAANSAGLIVGNAATYTPEGGYAGGHATVWGTNGNAAIDLNRLLSPSDASHWRLEQADAISDLNWIVGLGFYDPDASGPAGAYARSFMIKLGFGGDATGDDRVDFNDFLVLQNHFNQPGTFDQGDFNYDGTVNFNDFLILQNHFGQTLAAGTTAVSAAEVAALTAFGTANAVPEPATLAVAASTLLLMARRRRL